MLLLINMTLKKINILEYAFGEGGGGHQKAYAVYAFINVDNCERPLTLTLTLTLTKTLKLNPNLLSYWECCRNMVRRKKIAARPTPPSRAHVEAVAGSWGSVSAPAVNRVMGQSEINITNKYRLNYIWGRVL